MNAGKNGNSTTDLLLRVDKDVLAARPQLVVMMVGTNDRFNSKKLLSLEDYERNYQLLITKIKKQSNLILMTIPPVYDPYIILRKPELGLQGNGPNARVDSVNAVIKRLAEKNTCTLIDLNSILTVCGGADTHKDGLFQNEAGTDFGWCSSYCCRLPNYCLQFTDNPSAETRCKNNSLFWRQHYPRLQNKRRGYYGRADLSRFTQKNA